MAESFRYRLIQKESKITDHSSLLPPMSSAAKSANVKQKPYMLHALSRQFFPIMLLLFSRWTQGPNFPASQPPQYLSISTKIPISGCSFQLAPPSSSIRFRISFCTVVLKNGVETFRTESVGAQIETKTSGTERVASAMGSDKNSTGRRRCPNCDRRFGKISGKNYGQKVSPRRRHFAA